MSKKQDGNQNTQSANVLQLGFNISVSGDPGTDFQIVLDENGRGTVQPSSQNELQSSDILQIKDSSTKPPKHEIENIKLPQEVKPVESTGAIPKQNRHARKISSFDEPFKVNESSASKESSIIDEIKSTMEHFEKFSDHIKEIPRLKSHPVATSTPFSDKQNSKSETSLIYPEYRPRRFAHLYDFHSRKEYFKGSVKPLPHDLFLKPLPGEDFYKRGIVKRYFDLEPPRQYGSVDSLNKTSTVSTKSKYDEPDLSNDHPPGILKKSDSDNGDKLSTSSADSVKDIKIYQSGGILIMQNFKDNTEKKEISDFSAKLIENCNRLKEEINAGFSNVEEKPFIVSSLDEYKNSGKMVQFDLSGSENRKLKLSDSISTVQKDDSSSAKLESSESNSDFKNKDSSPQGTSQSQDFPSFSTQENDSVISNQPGTSPTYGTSEKKLEWDSGADVGYLNLDLSKENLSTIERIVLKGLSSDGFSEKKVVYEKKPEPAKTNRSKFILERMPSELVAEEIIEANKKLEVENKTKGNPEGKNKQETKGEKQETGQSRHLEEIPTEEVRESGHDNLKSTDENQTKPHRDRGSKEALSKKQKESTDKSVNVNTLFKDAVYQAEDPRQIESPPKYKSSRLSPRVRKLKKKRVPNHRTVLTAPLKEKIDSIIDIARCSGRSKDSAEMGIPKRVHRKLEANPEVELSREVEEIIIDQRFKIKQSVAVGREVTPTTGTTEDSRKETKTKPRPISASSSSINTVLPNTEGEKKKSAEPVKFTDQIIQTSDSVVKVESVGIQAFASLKSTVRKNQPLEVPKVSKVETVNTSSKNIQAYGLNSSLPRELAHPNKPVENQNTKSTQFFGGPINSLPNYHSNLITKPMESCGHMPKVLKTKKMSATDIILLREENEKNIKANDDSSKNSEPKSRLQGSDLENKENFITEKSTNSKRTGKSSKGTSGGSRESSKNAKGSNVSKVQAQTETPSARNSDCFRVSDDVSSNILTSEMLREHGGSIDRNIIQEKYFQSQLIEIEKREMKSKSTSMEKPEENIRKRSVSVGCQYSPQSKKSVGKQIEDNAKEKRKSRPRKKGTSEKSSQNLMEEFSDSSNHGEGDSIPSSAQTANGWISRTQDSGRNNSSGIGRARSFEYLPGHMYESRADLIEEPPSDTEPIIVTYSSSGSSIGGKNFSSDGLKDSEGRTTLILENSTESSHDSHGPMKIFSENLTQLNLVVSKLWEKDAQVQSVTQSLLVNLWNGGSGDYTRDLDTTVTPKTDVIDVNESPVDFDQRKGIGDTSSLTKSVKRVAKPKENEISIGCQTEEKTPASEPEKIYMERKVLEKRIGEEKENQIKWIENEIYHLNILRGMLEKQNHSSERKKKHQPATPPEKEEKYKKNVLAEVHPRPVTPVYGCTVSFSDTRLPEAVPPAEGPPPSPPSPPPPPPPIPPEENQSHSSEGVKYGMAVSVTSGCNTLRRMIVLPVGVQVSVNDKKLQGQRQRTPCNDANTQHPCIVRVNHPSTSIQTDFPTVMECSHCQQENCVCLELSDKTHESHYYSSKSSNKTSERAASFGTSGCGNNHQEPSGLKKMADSSTDTDPVTDHFSSLKKFQNAEKKDKRRSYSPGAFPKDSVMPVAFCKCENCPGRASLNSRAVSVQGPCRSNVHLNSNKSAEEMKQQCFKVQPQSSPNCACHVIKIYGAKCCLSEGPENNSEKRTIQTENQYCQTMDVLVMPKNQDCSDTRKHTRTRREAKDVQQPLCQTSRRAASAKNFRDKISVEVQTPSNGCNCGKKKTFKEKSKGDDHPRQYFLKIEETEVDELSEPVERKGSLEVITVTVPVKKTTKSKVYGKTSQHSYLSEPCSVDSINACKCCEKCLGRVSEKVSLQYESAGKTKTERPESLKKAPNRRQMLVDSYGDTDDCNGVDSYGYKIQRQSSMSLVCCEDKRADFPRSQHFYPNESWESNAEDFDQPTRDIPKDAVRDDSSDYDRCKDWRTQPKSYFENGNNRYFDDRNHGRRQNDERPGYEAEGRYKNEPSFDYRAQKYRRNERNSSDYYNYDKREFMTKSELLREKENRKRAHHPTLQECLENNRPDFYNNAENRRQIIAERAKERSKRHSNRMESLMRMMPPERGENERPRNGYGGSRRIFTSMQMREQTMRRYKNLPEVTEKIADQKKKEEYRTNKLMADIFSKKLQLEAHKGRMCVVENY